MATLRLTRFVRFENEGSLQAFCDVMIGETLLIKGIRVVEGRTGPFVTMPRQQSKNGKWHETVIFLNAEIRCEVSRLVLESYELSKNQQTEATRIP